MRAGAGPMRDDVVTLSKGECDLKAQVRESLEETLVDCLALLAGGWARPAWPVADVAVGK